MEKILESEPINSRYLTLYDFPIRGSFTFYVCSYLFDQEEHDKSLASYYSTDTRIYFNETTITWVIVTFVVS